MAVLLLFVTEMPLPVSIVMRSHAAVTCLVSTFVLTAPTISHKQYLRILLLAAAKLTCNALASPKCLVGLHSRGYLQHFTINQYLRFSFVSAEELERTLSFAIVRNPYARMVSLYLWNQFLMVESFKSF